MPTPQPRFDPKELVDLYQRQAYDRLSEEFLQVWAHFENTTYFSLDAQAQYFVNTFVKNFLYLFTQPDYVLNDRHAVRFIELNLTISNMVAASSFRNTDAYLDILSVQPRNFAKLLALYSSRNTRKIDYKVLFDANPQLASMWYSYYLEAYRSALSNKDAAANLKAHVQFHEDRLVDFYNISDICFGTTYIDPQNDKHIKHRVNAALRGGPLAQGAFIQNTPKKKQIAVASALWFGGHSVHRILGEFVNALNSDYELTLVHLGPVRNNIDIGPFKKILYCGFENGTLNIEPLRRNDFQMVFFPDVGMSTESIVLSNLRLAPIQVVGLGHSVSTFGGDIDYYISGKEVECVNLAEENYSERLVLLPGWGCVHEYPRYELKGLKKSTPKFVINCPWYAQKVNYPFLKVVRQIIDKAEKDVLLRMFPGGALVRKNDFLPFVRDVLEALGPEHVEIVPGKPYEEYMALLEEGDMSMDSYHFGGCNTVADSLHVRKAIVCHEGTKWYNRIGPATLRAAGLPELIATTDEEYIATTLKLINDDEYRAQVQAKVDKLDTAATAFNTKAGGQAFKRAIDFLIENHERLKAEGSKAPILID